MDIFTKAESQTRVVLPRWENSFVALIQWFRLDLITAQPWSSRLPGVFIASLFLTILLNWIGIPLQDKWYMLIPPLLGLQLALDLVDRP